VRAVWEAELAYRSGAHTVHTATAAVIMNQRPVQSLLPAMFADALGQRLNPTPDAHATDPALWARERLGVELWSKQVEMLQSIQDNRYTAAPSCHDVGKSFSAALAAVHWIDTHPPGEAFVVTSAPTGPQVSAILWREMRRLHQMGDLPGRVNLANEWYIPVGGVDELVAYGRKPGEVTGGAGFSGIHARFVLIILDEACGIPKWLFDAADTLATNEHARVFAPGNPDDPNTQFAEVCKPGSGWNVVPISAYDSPNFTDEPVSDRLRDLLISRTWVEERAKRWGRDSPLFKSKVLGEFPDVSDHALFTPTMIREAQERDLPGIERGVKAFDIARMGTNLTVGYWNRGGVIRKIYEAARQDTMHTAGDLMNLIMAEPDIPAWIDCDGLGVGVYDRLIEQGAPALEYHGGIPATDKARFINRRAEIYWMAREAMLDAMVDIDADDEDLAAQLGMIRFFVDSRGRIGIETKDDMRKRGVQSPDHADAFVMSLVHAGSVQLGTMTRKQTPGEGTLTGDLLGRPM
jgi:hypothetical protein